MLLLSVCQHGRLPQQKIAKASMLGLGASVSQQKQLYPVHYAPGTVVARIMWASSVESM